MFYIDGCIEIHIENERWSNVVILSRFSHVTHVTHVTINVAWTWPAVQLTGAVLDRIFIFVVSNPSILPIWPPAANFVVINNGGVRAYWNSRYRPIACHVLSFRELRLVVDYLEGSLSVATWYDSAWIGGTASGWIFIGGSTTISLQIFNPDTSVTKTQLVTSPDPWFIRPIRLRWSIRPLTLCELYVVYYHATIKELWNIRR